MKFRLLRVFIFILCAIGLVEKSGFAACDDGYLIGEECKQKTAGKYFDGSIEQGCPVVYDGENLLIGSGKLFVFTIDTDIKTFGIESCAIKLKGACGDGTNVIYTWNVEENRYVRKSGYKVTASTQSLIKTDEPGSTDLVDYCETCPSGQYNINGECGYCHSGHCVSDEGACEICPAGFACPGDGDIKNNNAKVMCSAATACGQDEYAESGSSQCSEYAIACGQDEYAESGSSQCSECAMGYSTYASGPAEEIDGKIFDGSCKKREHGFGIQCIASEACKSIPAQLCYEPYCKCKNSGAAGNTNTLVGFMNPMRERTDFITERLNCNSSYSLGDNKVWGPVNTKVVQTLRKNNY